MKPSTGIHASTDQRKQETGGPASASLREQVLRAASVDVGTELVSFPY